MIRTRILRHMATELRLNMRGDGFAKVDDLLKLNLKTSANIQLKSHTTDEIREVSFHYLRLFFFFFGSESSVSIFSDLCMISSSVVDLQAVRRDNKQRFSLIEENGELLIRANQGHSITVKHCFSLSIWSLF